MEKIGKFEERKSSFQVESEKHNENGRRISIALVGHFGVERAHAQWPLVQLNPALKWPLIWPETQCR